MVIKIKLNTSYKGNKLIKWFCLKYCVICSGEEAQFAGERWKIMGCLWMWKRIYYTSTENTCKEEMMKRIGENWRISEQMKKRSKRLVRTLVTRRLNIEGWNWKHSWNETRFRKKIEEQEEKRKIGTYWQYLTCHQGPGCFNKTLIMKVEPYVSFIIPFLQRTTILED